MARHKIAKVKVFAHGDTESATEYGIGAAMIWADSFVIKVTGNQLGVTLASNWDAESQSVTGDLIVGRYTVWDGAVLNGWVMH